MMDLSKLSERVSDFSSKKTLVNVEESRSDSLKDFLQGGKSQKRVADSAESIQKIACQLNAPDCTRVQRRSFLSKVSDSVRRKILAENAKIRQLIKDGKVGYDPELAWAIADLVDAGSEEAIEVLEKRKENGTLPKEVQEFYEAYDKNPYSDKALELYKALKPFRINHVKDDKYLSSFLNRSAAKEKKLDDIVVSAVSAVESMTPKSQQILADIKEKADEEADSLVERLTERYNESIQEVIKSEVAEEAAGAAESVATEEDKAKEDESTENESVEEEKTETFGEEEFEEVEDSSKSQPVADAIKYELGTKVEIKKDEETDKLGHQAEIIGVDKENRQYLLKFDDGQELAFDETEFSLISRYEDVAPQTYTSSLVNADEGLIEVLKQGPGKYKLEVEDVEYEVEFTRDEKDTFSYTIRPTHPIDNSEYESVWERENLVEFEDDEKKPIEELFINAVIGEEQADILNYFQDTFDRVLEDRNEDPDEDTKVHERYYGSRYQDSAKIRPMSYFRKIKDDRRLSIWEVRECISNQIRTASIAAGSHTFSTEFALVIPELSEFTVSIYMMPEDELIGEDTKVAEFVVTKNGIELYRNTLVGFMFPILFDCDCCSSEFDKAYPIKGWVEENVMNAVYAVLINKAKVRTKIIVNQSFDVTEQSNVEETKAVEEEKVEESTIETTEDESAEEIIEEESTEQETVEKDVMDSKKMKDDASDIDVAKLAADINVWAKDASPILASQPESDAINGAALTFAQVLGDYLEPITVDQNKVYYDGALIAEVNPQAILIGATAVPYSTTLDDLNVFSTTLANEVISSVVASITNVKDDNSLSVEEVKEQVKESTKEKVKEGIEEALKESGLSDSIRSNGRKKGKRNTYDMAHTYETYHKVRDSRQALEKALASAGRVCDSVPTVDEYLDSEPNDPVVEGEVIKAVISNNELDLVSPSLYKEFATDEVWQINDPNKFAEDFGYELKSDSVPTVVTSVKTATKDIPAKWEEHELAGITVYVGGIEQVS